MLGEQWCLCLPGLANGLAIWDGCTRLHALATLRLPYGLQFFFSTTNIFCMELIYFGVCHLVAHGLVAHGPLSPFFFHVPAASSISSKFSHHATSAQRKVAKLLTKA